MRLIHDDHADIRKTHLSFFQAVVERFYHGNKTVIVWVIAYHFHIAVNDLVGNSKFEQHLRGLLAQFNSVCEYQYLFAGSRNIFSGNFGKDHGLAATGGELVQQVIIVGVGVDVIKDHINRSMLVIIELFP